MSIDMVDDLHSAEDTIGLLRQSLYTLWEFAENHPWTGLGDAPKYVKDALALGMANAADYCRPSCERDEADGTYLCDDDCGCPGHHEPQHDNRDEK